MRSILLFLICTVPFLGQSQVSVNYSVFYSPTILEDGLKVELNYKTKKAQDSIYLHYSNQVWGEQDLFNCLHILETENPNLTFSTVPDSNRIVVHYPKSKMLQFVYRIKQDFVGDSIDITNRPRMNNAYFHILGEELFVVPEDVFYEKERRIHANISWVGFPSDYVIHNTFESQKRNQTIKTNLHSGFFHSLFVGGDYRLYSFSHRDKPIVFAIRGTWYSEYADDQTMVEALKKTISVQREFWNDYQQDYYTVIMSPTVSQNDSLFRGQSMVGSAVKNGFMIQSSNNVFNQFAVLRYIFNHELMHEWIGLTIRNAHEELNYWFSEGFTDYYTYKNRLRSDDISFEEWCESFNVDVIQAHYDNPQRNKPNYIIVDDFWKSRDVEKIPYRRGAIFAFWLDNKIQLSSNHTKSLDDLMRHLLIKCKTQNIRLTDELFLEEVKPFIQSEDISYEFQKYILNGEDLELKSEELLDCFEVEHKDGVPQLVLKGEKNRYLGTEVR